MRTSLRSRFASALVAFILSVAVLAPSALSLPQHPDEAQYAWTGAYYGGRLARFDLRPAGSDLYGDPGWSPYSWWARTQPMGSRMVYALAMGLSGAAPPSLPYSYSEPSLQGSNTMVPDSTLQILRFVALACVGLGFALFAFRLGWPGFALTILMLLTPGVRDSLAGAWAEGPLLLGFGLCAAAYGSRWFGPTCGLAAAFKLTALGLWPLAFWHGLGNGRYAHILGLISAAITWTILTPPSWFSGGPSYLISMLVDRAWEYTGQSAAFPGPFGLFLPARYVWPIELAALLALIILAPRLWHRIARPIASPDRTAT